MRKVAIVGKGPTVVSAPYFNPEWEIWGLSWVKYPREDQSFEPHSLEVQLTDPCYKDINHILQTKQDIPVWTVPGSPYFSNIKEFPFKELFEEFGGIYFESSIAYMLGLARLQRVPHVGIWGVNLATRDEYFEQRPNLEYLIGYCRGKGMTIEISPGSCLMSSAWVDGRYGITNNHRFR